MKDTSEKVCTKCKQTKPIEEFYYRKNRGHYESSCKRCSIIAIEACRIKRESQEGPGYFENKRIRHRASERLYDSRYTSKEKARIRVKEEVDGIKDSYILHLLSESTGVAEAELKKMSGIEKIIETKRLALRIKRELYTKIKSEYEQSGTEGNPHQDAP